MVQNKIYEGEKISSFRELVYRYETRYMDKDVFVYKDNPKSTDYIRVNYKDFAQDIKRFGTALLNLGLQGKKVALIGPNRYEWCVSYLAVTTSDIGIVPLDKSLPNNEIESLIYRSNVDAVIFDKSYENIFINIRDKNDTNIKNFICMDNNNNFLSFPSLIKTGQSLMENGDFKYADINLDPNKVSIFLYTSGTTSISKCVGLSQANICADIYALSQMTDIRTTDTFLSFLPLHHTFESTTTFLYGTSCGITIAFCDSLKYVQKNLVEYNITGFVCVPLMLEVMYKKILKGIYEQGKTTLVKFMRKVCNLLLKFKIDIRKKVFKEILDQLGGKIRILIAGGAPMNKEAIQGFLDFGIILLQGYGLTETSPVLAGENEFYSRVGSVGLPMPGVDIKIDNPNKDGIGEIIAKGPTIMSGYIDNEEANKEVLKNGWFHTGDLGKFDKDGYLFVTGRKKDVIVLKNGKNIYPEEIEILINKLPYVEESMVFGKPAKDNDLMICAKIVYNSDYLKENYSNLSKEDYHNFIWQDIKSKINKSMPTYKYIREIIVTDEPLIKTTTQKIKRFEEIKKILGEQ